MWYPHWDPPQSILWKYIWVYTYTRTYTSTYTYIDIYGNTYMTQELKVAGGSSDLGSQSPRIPDPRSKVQDLDPRKVFWESIVDLERIRDYQSWRRILLQRSAVCSAARASNLRGLAIHSTSHVVACKLNVFDHTGLRSLCHPMP